MSRNELSGFWNRNILGAMGAYNDFWRPGSLRRQVINALSIIQNKRVPIFPYLRYLGVHGQIP